MDHTHAGLAISICWLPEDLHLSSEFLDHARSEFMHHHSRWGAALKMTKIVPPGLANQADGSQAEFVSI